MARSGYREQRARQAMDLFEWLVQWEGPPSTGEQDAPWVRDKFLLVRSAGREVLKHLLREKLVGSPEAEERLRATASYCENIFDNSEVKDGGHGVAERIFPNIYDVLFASRLIHGYRSRENFLCRGQFNSVWHLRAAYYRSVPIPTEHLVAIKRKGQLAYLHSKHRSVDLSQLSPIQQDAVIQHYLSGTRLIDFTDSIDIAAFFATGGDKDRLDEIPPMGAIYLMSRSDVENLGVGKVEAPELPLQFLRIHRQRGRFIQPTYPGLLAEAGLFDRWVFHHTEVGLPFICPALGVSRDTLMPEEIESIDTTGLSPPAV